MSRQHRLWLTLVLLVMGVVIFLSWKVTIGHIISSLPQAQEVVDIQIDRAAGQLEGMGETVEEKSSGISDSYEIMKESYEAEKARQVQEQNTTSQTDSSQTYGKEVHE